jgi:SHS2 domain-containing protein
MMKPFESFNHTADVGLRIRGRDLKELFVHAAEGLFDLIAGPKSVGAQLIAPLPIEVSAPSQEELLVAWLRELIYLSSARRMVFFGFKINRMDVGVTLRIHAEIFGEKMNSKKHVLKKEVKAITYHGLSLKQGKKSWVAEVIFDV